MSRFAPLAVAVAASALLCGCQAKIYRAETVVHDDGSISRAVYQPADETPEAVRQSAAWENVTYAPRVPHDEWNASIDSLPPATQDKDRPYFAARGEFPSAGELPQTFHKAAPDGLADGTLELDYQQNDLVLVVEHRWRETLTDIVTLDDMHRARRELADTLIPLAEKILNRGLGDEYDTTAVVDWMHNTAEPMVFDLTDVIFDLGARGELSQSDQVGEALEPVFQRYGISIRDPSGKLLEGDQLQAVFHDHLQAVLSEKLRRRDGQPVRPAVIDEILQWIGVQEVPEGFEKSKRYENAAKEVIIETYGSDELFGAALKPNVYRILGLYRGDLVAAAREFEYTLTMPGVIVETSGELLSDKSTRFRFEDNQAFPFGYSMSCRSLVLTKSATEFLGADIATDRKKLLAYVDLVKDNSLLIEVMQKCVAAGDIGPLQRARDESAPASPETAKYDALLAMLKSAPMPGD